MTYKLEVAGEVQALMYGLWGKSSDSLQRREKLCSLSACSDSVGVTTRGSSSVTDVHGVDTHGVLVLLEGLWQDKRRRFAGAFSFYASRER